MMKRGYVLGALFLVASCSNNAAPGGGDGGGGGIPPDMAAMVPSEGGVVTVGDSVTLVSTSFTLNPGDEVFKCQDFANPFNGSDVDIKEWDSHMTPGSHHLLAFYKANATDVPLADCNPLQFGPVAFGAQIPDASLVFPATIGSLLQGTNGFHVQMHYLNTTMQPFDVHVTVTMHKAMPGEVTQHAGIYFMNNASGIHVKAGATEDITASYTFKQPVNLLSAFAHMHKFSNSMTATIGGQPLYNTTSWDNSTVTLLSPAMPVAVGTTVTWTCNVTNTTGGLLTFGESAINNDMCIFEGYYYPVPAGQSDPTISSMQ